MSKKGLVLSIIFAAFIVYIYGPLVAAVAPTLVDTVHDVNHSWCMLLDLTCEKTPKPPCVFRMGRDVCIR